MENKTFREELLNWINRWKEVNIKKNQYKKAKKSMIGTNQHLLEQVEKQKIMIIRLKAKLAEARRVVDLQNRTWWLFPFSVIWFVSLSTGNKSFFVHACKITDFTGTHLNYGFFCYFYSNRFLIICFCLFKNRWACHRYPLQFQDVSNIRDISWKTWMFIEDWNFNTATNLPVPLNQQMFQASCFYCYILVTSVCWKELMLFNSDRTPIVLHIAFIEKLNRKTSSII